MTTRLVETCARHEATGAIRSTFSLSIVLAALFLAGASRAGGDLAVDTDSDWLPRVQQAIAEKEYEASHNDLGLQAPNRVHDLRTYFDAAGVRVHDRTAPGSPELLGLSLVGVGRGEDLAPVAAGEVESAGARVEIHRPGLVEWYVNSPAGLEQGFTLEAAPEGEGAVALELAVRRARAALAGERVVFTSPTGRRLEYGALAAFDSRGTSVEARFEVPSENRLRIVLAAQDAVYPLTVDPLLTETADAQLESDQADSWWGHSVSGAGDINGDGYADVIVGAYKYDAGDTDEGAAFVFLGSASGIVDADPSTAAAQIESNQADAWLGNSVSGAGDVNGDGYADVIVGAVTYNAVETDEGAAFVFLGSSSGIVGCVGSSPPRCDPTAAAAQFESDQASARLGNSVSGAGDVDGDGYADVIVGAYTYGAGETQEGAAFVFLGSASGIADGNPTTAAAQLESDQVGAHLGWRVSGAGDVNGDGYADVIVGAYHYNADFTDDGAAFVFMGSASGIAGCIGSSPPRCNPTTAAAQLESDQPFATMGYSVSGAGDVNGDGYADVIVGAVGYAVDQADEGAAFVFLGSASGVADGDPTTAAAQIESDQANAALGWSVSGAGDIDGDGYADVIVGAQLYDAGESNEGAAFVYMGSSSGLVGCTGLSPPRCHAADATAQLESDQAGARLGWSVSGAGDVNGDGYADVIVGAIDYDAGETDEGAAFVYLGGSPGVVDGDYATAATHLWSDAGDPLSSFGMSVSGAGDVNGDGYADVIVGAPAYDAGEEGEGAAFVFLGGASGIADGDSTTAAAQLESDQATALLGYSVSGAGDVNGDGYADVIVGAYQYDADESNEGAAFVFMGDPSGIAGCVGSSPPRCDASTAAAQLEPDQADAKLGNSVSGAGDVNGDGYADVIVGAHQYDADESNEGAAFVFMGDPSGIAGCVGSSPPRCDASTAAAQLESDQADARFGDIVSGAGDVNGDGYADVIVGAYWYDADETDEGAAFVFLGSASGIADGNPSTAAAQLESDQAGAWLGYSVSGAGDVDGDGYADVIVGAPVYSAGESFEGAAFVFRGSASGIADGNPATAHAHLEPNQPDRAMGGIVSGAGDVNGDGYADVIVTSSIHPFLFHGSASGIGDGDLSNAAAELSIAASAVCGAGDVNGDGYADVILGNSIGEAFLFLGNDDGDGRPVLASQLRDDGSGTPVEPWGSSGSPDTFQVSMTATHPGGRGRVKLEVESCAPGVAFGDTSCAGQVSASWTDVGASGSGVTLTETVPVPFGETLRRWRARVLYAPYSVTQSGITSPPNPAHGPWRRVTAQTSEADIRRQLREEVTVPSGTNVSESLLGGPPSWGGVDVTFDDTSGGDLTAQFTPVPAGPSLQDLLADPGSLNFNVGGDPAQLWEIQLDGSFSGTVTLTFQYDDQNLLVAEADLEVTHYEGGAWVALPKVAQDLVDNTITVTTTSLSPFLLTGPESSSIGWTFSGTASGGSIFFTVGAVFLEVETSAGQTAAEVATAVAAAINGDAILTAAGITAAADQNAVTTDGAVTSTTVEDSGLDYTPILLPAQVPSLGGSGAALLAALIITAVSYAWRQRRTDPLGAVAHPKRQAG